MGLRDTEDCSGGFFGGGDVALRGVGDELGLREFLRQKSGRCKVLYQIFLYLCDRISYVG